MVEGAAWFRNPRTEFSYPIRDETAVFLPAGVLEGPNVRYQKLYDRIAPAYDFGTRAYAWWKSGAEATRRKAYLELLEVLTGASLLEVSVGTGANWPYLNRNLDFYGLDLGTRLLVVDETEELAKRNENKLKLAPYCLSGRHRLPGDFTSLYFLVTANIPGTAIGTCAESSSDPIISCGSSSFDYGQEEYPIGTEVSGGNKNDAGTWSGGVPLSSVPEPSSFGLLLTLALLCVGTMTHPRKRERTRRLPERR